jgi:hypothetical protein
MTQNVAKELFALGQLFVPVMQSVSFLISPVSAKRVYQLVPVAILVAP